MYTNCPKCGTLMIIVDNKLICPNCDTKSDFEIKAEKKEDMEYVD